MAHKLNFKQRFDKEKKEKLTWLEKVIKKLK